MPYNTMRKVDLGSLSTQGHDTHANGNGIGVTVTRVFTAFMTVSSIGTSVVLTLIGSYDGTNWGQLRGVDGDVIQVTADANGTWILQYQGACPFVAVELTTITAGSPSVACKSYSE